MRPFFAPALLLLVLGRPAFAEGQAERNLTLDEALDALIEKNPNLAMARAQADQARGVARQASAALQPVLGAQGSYALNNEEVIVSFNNFVTALEEAVNQLVSSPVTFDRITFLPRCSNAFGVTSISMSRLASCWPFIMSR